MLILRLKGGLGNQIFQIVHAFEIAKPDEKISVDYTHFLGDFEKDYAGRDLNIQKILNSAQIGRLSFFKMPQLVNKFFWKLISLIGRKEDLSLGRIRFLDGYFHKASLYPTPSKYRSYLNLKPNYTLDVNADSVLIHVRKGDYTNGINAQIYYNCESDYFEKAIAEIKKQMSNPTFFIMSNDNLWVKKNFTFLDNYQIIDTQDTIESFKTMCRFSNFIISNSTFSWWPALLAEPRGVVIAPRKWFLADAQNDDLYPKEWIKI